MAAFMTDGTFTSAVAVGAARVSFPIPGDTATRIIEQDFMILFANFSALALSTAHGTFTTAYLIGETPLQDLGGGVARWTRIYANIPANRTEYDTFSYNFIGFVATTLPNRWATPDPASNPFRDRFVQTVLSKTLYVYYLPGVSGGITTVDDIVVIPATTYYVTSYPTNYWDYLDTNTTPTKAAYGTLITTDAGTASSYSLVAEASRVTRWAGNIWERSTRYVKAL